MIDRVPHRPDLPADARAAGTMRLRFEDVAQDGRILLTALPAGVYIVWYDLLTRHPLTTVVQQQQGIYAILTRLVVGGTDATATVRSPVHVAGGYWLSALRGPGGAVEKVFLNVQVDASVDDARLPVGRVYAEHTYTRPFAAAEERAVVRFDAPGVPPEPSVAHAWVPREAVSAMPAGADAADPEPVADPVRSVLGVDHTDANRHVNSIVYPRMLLDAALRRFDALGWPCAVMARYAEIGFRKPAFAGDAVRILLRAYRRDGVHGVVGTFVPAADVAARPYCYGRIEFL